VRKCIGKGVAADETHPGLVGSRSAAVTGQDFMVVEPFEVRQ